MVRENTVLAVVLNYLPTAANYALAIAYIVVLTRYIPLTQYGYYNALFAIINSIGALIPIPGISGAIAREGAIEYARGGDVKPYFSAMVFMSLIMAVIYGLLIALATPFYIGNGIPRWMLGTAYIYVGVVFIQSIAGALGLYLWLVGRVASQGMGLTINILAMRVMQVLLIIIMRNVYALAISVFLGSLAQFIYYLGIVRGIADPLAGVGVVKNRIKGFLEFGFQSWLLGYMGTLSYNLLMYLVYVYLGPEFTGIYGLASAIANAVTALGPAVSTVMNSRLSQGLGIGIDVSRTFRDYAIPSFIAASLLAQLIVLALPILPTIGIISGGYVKSIPYASVLLGYTPLAVIVNIYTSYYWVVGRGWYALIANIAGLGLGILAYVLFHSLGIYMAIASNYLIYALTLVVFWFSERWSIRSIDVLVIGLSLVLTLISSCTLLISDLPITWPLIQLINIAVLIAALYIFKPLPRSLINQVPGFARPMITPFIKSE
ncbi:oligosaccharide flippase family protein [Vulcanisaeta distributa]|uniref:Polysaccharide biosynthesis protein n=1 Tax=Vulcanisaeta distributa (strain DSM 14429 / JCM 11212 / NBRC 100878 / IC-017) TaxID=572478 RepID=E1QTC4_VULDI|nr:oligosaccharide flippase family protein [Vulcanisaeta distributa]ADN50917.1 polysaccharide biosynthesis protein [Vulcanisaeta distributa DSM 14429]